MWLDDYTDGWAGTSGSYDSMQFIETPHTICIEDYCLTHNFTESKRPINWVIKYPEGGEKMDATIYGILAFAFFALSVLISINKNEKGEENLLLVYLFQIAGLLMARLGLRTSAEMAIVDYNSLVAGNFNTGAVILTFVLYGYMAFLVVQTIFYLRETVEGVKV